ncbi:MAG: UDP-N-acetyl-D-mannosamine dehydrogenase [Candidatus Cloacimonetes bacterium]|nr:UDP-N-acetyl-D-mannosamine dehydrogenase [Candidatus Cloacimonadota bacterium]
MEKKFEVVVMGLGYIGLPTAALIAGNKIKVKGIDLNEEVVKTINKGKVHIVEPDLDGLVSKVVSEKLMQADTKPCEADVFLIAVPTPFKEDHKPDLSYVESAVEAVTPYLRKGNLLVIESTSPVGTTGKMADLVFQERPELKGDLFIAYCPERVLPGKILYELENNDRVIGGLDESSAQKAVNFYSRFVKGNLHKTNARTAEMCKLVENSYRDVNIAFANELSMICNEVDIDVDELIMLAGKHPRVNILNPGCGVGGHCIAIDPWFLVSEFGEKAKIIKAARDVNNHKADWVFKNIITTAEKFEREMKSKPVIATMGLAYKPDIDDLRESPALYIMKRLKKTDYKILAVEPNIPKYEGKDLVPYIEAEEKADIIVYLVAHREFKKRKIENKIVLDYCGVTK